MTTSHWIVGPEYDQRLLRRLGAVLGELGFDLSEHSDALAGSQEIYRWEFQSPRGALIVESETYMGLSVQGPDELVRLVQQRVEQSNAF